eukprot:96869-Chlamydomonas_euryale.AAC.3
MNSAPESPARYSRQFRGIMKYFATNFDCSGHRRHALSRSRATCMRHLRRHALSRSRAICTRHLRRHTLCEPERLHALSIIHESPVEKSQKCS